MTKPELRKRYKALRKTLTDAQLDDYSVLIANQLLRLDIWNLSFYHLFLTIEEQHEVNTEFILNILSGKDKNSVVSKSDFNSGSMTHYLLTDNTTLKKNVYNIPEPVDGIPIAPNTIDVVFVPLLAFDKKGHRVGYGKGFYDRFLASCKPDVIKVGLSFFEAEIEFSDISENDIALDFCVTPKTIYQF